MNDMNTTAEPKITKQTGKDLFAGLFIKTSNVTNDPHLASLKKQAQEAFEKLDFPTIRDEDWKYTNVAPILKASYNTPSSGASDSVSFENVKSVLPDNFEGIVLT